MKALSIDNIARKPPLPSYITGSREWDTPATAKQSELVFIRKLYDGS
jgi:hypothetical protein